MVAQLTLAERWQIITTILLQLDHWSRDSLSKDRLTQYNENRTYVCYFAYKNLDSLGDRISYRRGGFSKKLIVDSNNLHAKPARTVVRNRRGGFSKVSMVSDNNLPAKPVCTRVSFIVLTP